MRIPVQQCSQYSETLYPSGLKGLGFLTDNLTVNDGGDTDTSIFSIGLWTDTRTVTAFPFAVKNQTGELFCTKDMTSSPGNDDKSEPIYDHPSECLVFEGKEHCQLLYDPAICIIISLATLAKVVAIVFAARVNHSRPPPLLTTGDAVASFLEQPDSTTRGMCWASSRYFRNGHWKNYFELQGGQKQNISYRQISRREQWRKASSAVLWLVTSIWFVIQNH